MNITTEAVEITSQGIKKFLKKYNPERAVAEYIWNGFDAHASEIHVNYKFEQTYKSITELSVTDNGDGIVFEDLPVVFKKFYESRKASSANLESRFSRGKNGYGRLTFFKFAEHARWFTVYKKDEGLIEYRIDIDSRDLKNYTTTDRNKSNLPHTQTEVVFTEICDDNLSISWIELVLKPYLRADFAWYLKVHPECKIYVAGELLDCSSVIADNEEFDLSVSIDDGDDELFHCYYFQWAVKPEEEYSRFYYMDSEGELKHQDTTLLNNKGDYFWHSVIVKSTFFNSFTYTGEEGQNLFNSLPERRKFNQLNDKLNEYLRDKRKPFLKVKAGELVVDYEKEKLFSFIGSAPWERARKDYLIGFIKELYEVEPAVFTSLNYQQKKIFVRLLDQVMDPNNRESLFKILDGVVDLDPQEKNRFAKILETTRLKCVISTIQLVEDRIETIKAFRKVNFDHTLKAGEVKHLQKLIETHYWIFGEEYRFVSSENVKFTKALERYKYILYGVEEKEYIEHPDKYKEMDLFVTGQEFMKNSPSNLVVEIKSPTNVPKLTMEHYSQINTYMNVIRKVDGFNDPNTYWTFLLVGLKIDDIADQQINEPLTGLCIKKDNYRLYMKTWDQVLNEADARFKYLKEKLESERAELAEIENLDELMDKTLNNSAAAMDVIQ
jgi:hypothetical protein